MLAVSGLSILLTMTPVTASAGEKGIFACDVGANRVEVVREGHGLVYRFGPAGAPALRVAGDPAAGTLSNASMPLPVGEVRILRFRQGTRSYVVYNVFNREPGDVWVDDGGVLVLDGDREVERLTCRMGDWRDPDGDPLDGRYSDVTALSGLPGDSQPLYRRVWRAPVSGRN